ncbi:mannose-1-phosphate guanylyltransferase [Cryptococcus neoformans]|nr:mannose-1-phosphate guanylyltransferase [Cryptococcus neoformans var. grubii]
MVNKSLTGKSRARLASPFWRLKFRWRRKQWSGAVSSFPTKRSPRTLRIKFFSKF